MLSGGQTVAVIFHLAEPVAWADAQRSGTYAPASFEDEGFIHGSTAEQVPATYRRYYADRTDLVLLALDDEGLDVRWEAAPSSELFPHVYSAIPTAKFQSRGTYLGDEIE